MAGIISAAAVYAPRQPSPQSGLEILRHWQDVTTDDNYQAWLLSDLANYMAMSGLKSSSVSVAEQATALAVRNGNFYEIYLRQLDEAKILIRLGQFAQALALVERDVGAVEPAHAVKAHLLATKAHRELHDVLRAQEQLQNALNVMEAWDLDYFRLSAEQLASTL